MATALHSMPIPLYSPLSIPIFLCPILRKFLPTSVLARRHNVCHSKTQKRRYQLEAPKPLISDLPASPNLLALLRLCPGCGAFTQSVDPEGAGFYNTTRRSVKAFLAQHDRGQLGEAETFKQVVGHANQDILRKLGLHEPLEVTGGELQAIYFGTCDS